MQIVDYEVGVEIAANLTKSEHLDVPGGDAFRGLHPRLGDILVVLTTASGALIQEL